MMTNQATHLRAADIRRISDVLEAICRRGSAPDADDRHTAHGMHLPTGIDAIEGDREIRVFWQEAMGTDLREATLDVVVVDHHDDAVIGVGPYLLTGAGAAVIDQGKYIVIWKQEHGRWKLHLDIWSTRRSARTRQEST